MDRRLWFAVTVVSAVPLVLPTAVAQPPLGRKVVVQSITSPAIDRGLRDLDPPGQPGGRFVVPPELEGIQMDPRPYEPGRLIVKFHPGTSAASVGSVAATVGGRVLRHSESVGFDVLAIPPDADPERLARQMSARSEVVYAEPAYRLRPLFTPNDEFFDLQWHLSAIGLERAWEINRGASSNVVVAVLDSGVAYRDALIRYTTIPIDITPGQPTQVTLDMPFSAAPDLAAPDRFVAPRDFIWNDEVPVDLLGHGTHVAGTIGQLTNNGTGVAGLAFNVRIMPVKVLGDVWDLVFNAPNTGTSDVLAEAIRYAVDNGANVINLSLGFFSSGPSPLMEQVLGYAVDNGVFVSIAGGNDFLDGNRPIQPAATAPLIDGVVSVAAVGRDLRRAVYSNTGSYIEVAAPGGDQSRGDTTAGILQQSLDQDFLGMFPPRFDMFAYEFLDGTSFAAPHVAGLAALLVEQGVKDPAAIEAAIRAGARDLGAPGPDDAFGSGLIDARATLRGLGLAQ